MPDDREEVVSAVYNDPAFELGVEAEPDGVCSSGCWPAISWSWPPPSPRIPLDLEVGVKLVVWDVNRWGWGYGAACSRRESRVELDVGGGRLRSEAP